MAVEMRYTEEDLKIMEDFEDEMMRIHDNPLFYEDDMNLDLLLWVSD